MAYCTKCGKQLTDGAKFCANCGMPVNESSLSCTSERKTVFEGKIHKCPHCGEVLSSFATICTSCNKEIRGGNIADSIKELYNKISTATSTNDIIRLIRLFPVPNSKEDIFEFMFMASSNFDEDYYVSHLNEDDISDAWLAKIEQCYQKAKLILSDNDREGFESLYYDIKKRVDKAKVNHSNKISKQEIDEAVKVFNKSKLKILLIAFAIFSVLCCAVAFNDGKIGAGIVAIVMCSLLVTAYLIGSNVIKLKIKNLCILPIILAFVLFVVYFSLYGAGF